MLYVALIEVTEKYYQSGSSSKKEIHIINAESQDHAIEKLERKYDLQCIDYHISYSINIESINELID